MAKSVPAPARSTSIAPAEWERSQIVSASHRPRALVHRRDVPSFARPVVGLGEVEEGDVAVEHAEQLLPALRGAELRLHAQIVQEPHEALGDMQVGAEVVGLGQDDVAAASKPPGVTHDLEQVDGGVVADDYVPGTRSDHVGDVVPELARFLHPTLGRPRPPALVAPALGQQAADAVRHLHRHGAHGVRVEMNAARSASRELVGVAGERVAPIEREAGFQGMHGRMPGGDVRARYCAGDAPLISHLEFFART